MSTEEYNEIVKDFKSDDDILDEEQEDIEIEQNKFLKHWFNDRESAIKFMFFNWEKIKKKYWKIKMQKTNSKWKVIKLRIKKII
uniref:Uncharacterized protein n=1 Tax=Meloidogyne enterolobii TaxID=390850 RepID=A0A6V7TH53_MELEN|nr:unnamed protein product [Meloidogyne enterolobii]